MRMHRGRSAAIGVLACCASPLLLAQGAKVSLSTAPRPGQVVRYRMTQEMTIDVAPDGAGDIALPAAKMTGKTVLATTLRAGDADEEGRVKVSIIYDEFTSDMNVNGQPSPAMRANPLLGKTFEATYSADGAIVDMKGPPGLETMTEPMKQMVEQMSGRLARVQLAVGETATQPLSMPLPVPIPGAAGLGLTGESTVKLVSLEADGDDRIASCENVFQASMTHTFQPGDGAGGGLTVDLKVSGTGTSRINVDRHVMRSNDGTIAIDGTVSMTLPQATAPSRMTVHGSIRLTMAEVR